MNLITFLSILITPFLLVNTKALAKTTKVGFVYLRTPGDHGWTWMKSDEVTSDCLSLNCFEFIDILLTIQKIAVRKIELNTVIPLLYAVVGRGRTRF